MSQTWEYFSIGEVAQQTGLRASALRYYESEGILPVPQRIGGKRWYDADIFQHIRLIRAAQQSGFSIEEIRSLLNSSETDPPYAERLRELAQRKLIAVEQLIADAEAMKRVLQAALNCQCIRMEDCLLFLTAEE